MTLHAGRIRVVTAGAVPDDLVTVAAQGVSRAFQRPVEVVGDGFDPAAAFDRLRNQYDSTRVLEEIHRRCLDGPSKVLAVTDLDLFVPVFTFVFGEAQLGGMAAVVSLFRLRNSFYGLPEDRDLLVDRLVKESVHELGHTFGLVHCHDPRCVMHASPAVEEVDLKRADLCDACRALVASH